MLLRSLINMFSVSLSDPFASVPNLIHIVEKYGIFWLKGTFLASWPVRKHWENIAVCFVKLSAYKTTPSIYCGQTTDSHSTTKSSACQSPSTSANYGSSAKIMAQRASCLKTAPTGAVTHRTYNISLAVVNHLQCTRALMVIFLITTSVIF